MTSQDIVKFEKIGFDSTKYLRNQQNEILNRVDKYRDGRLYLEIGGKFLFDPHAARVLPGFQPDIKKQILKNVRHISELLFCINSTDIEADRQLYSHKVSYKESTLKLIGELEQELGIKPIIVVNRCAPEAMSQTEIYINELQSAGYQVYKRYFIDGYPSDVEKILSSEGYGRDEHIDFKKNLVLVIGAASNSGKLSTALGQIYLDSLKGIDSGYAKFETFPIWSLPISHPINLAYEAATADIGDYNVIDHYHEIAYNQRSVNYNRDVEAFQILQSLIQKILPENNPTRQYKSPTDMGVNYAGSAIINDELCCIASLNEIRRRAKWYQQQLDTGNGDEIWVKKCESLGIQALKYIEERNYNQNILN